MQKPFYSEYLDTYLDGCQKLVDQGLMTPEDIMKRIDIPLVAMSDLFNNRYSFTLSRGQTEKLFEEVDKMYFFMSYSEKERQEVVDSYRLLNERKDSLSPQEYTLYKKAEGQLDRIGFFDKPQKQTIKPKI